MTGAAEAETPSLIWRDVASLRIHCLLTSESGAEQGLLQRRICDRVRELATAGAPVPVSEIGPGDPALLAPDTVTLLVHGSVQPSAAGDLLAFAIRPFRNSAEPAGLLFAAAPRAVLLSGDGAALDAALSAALSETLPWLAGPAGPRRIDR